MSRNILSLAEVKTPNKQANINYNIIHHTARLAQAKTLETPRSHTDFETTLLTPLYWLKTPLGC